MVRRFITTNARFCKSKIRRGKPRLKVRCSRKKSTKGEGLLGRSGRRRSMRHRQFGRSLEFAAGLSSRGADRRVLWTDQRLPRLDIGEALLDLLDVVSGQLEAEEMAVQFFSDGQRRA